MTNKEAIEWLSAMRDRNDYQRKEALDMAIEALKQTQWIPCEERLPEVGVAVFISDGENTCEAHLRESKEYFLEHRSRWLIRTEAVDAWMPLPKPYEGGTE